MVVILVNINVNTPVLLVIKDFAFYVLMDTTISMANAKKFTMMAISEDLKFVMIII